MIVRLASFVVIALALSTPCTAAPPLKSREEARRLVDSTMELVVSDKIDEAFNHLKVYWPLPANEIDSIVMKTLAARNMAGDRYGKTLGYTFVGEETVGEILVRFTYLERREHHPLRWVFYFYRADTSWYIDAASWDDQIQALFPK